MDKSEELAKLLGIKPIIQQITKQYVANWGVHHFRDLKIKSKKYLLKIAELKRLNIDYVEDGLINDNYHQISYKIIKYPDFTKPSNFVKLFQLFFDTHFENWKDCKSTGMPEYWKKYEYTVQEWLIKHILWCYNVPPEYGHKFEDWKKLFKHQAQQTEWEY